MASEWDSSRRDAIGKIASSALRGKAWWRSVGDYADTPEFAKWAQNEFPAMAEELESRPAGPSRRSFLQLMAASAALAGLGLSGCRRPEDKIRPYNAKPNDMVLGKGMYYATTFVMAGKAMGVLAETHEGRPTKIEGNPKHPNSLGATDLFAQASVLDLYDPDRSRNFLHDGRVASRDEFLAFAASLAKQLKETQGNGLAILSEDSASPAVDMLLEHVRKAMPQAVICVYEPFEAAGPKAVYDLSKADVILSLDCDLLGTEDDGARNRQAFAAGRTVDQTQKMNRLYVVEPSCTITGASGDHRFVCPAESVGDWGEYVLAALTGLSTAGAYKQQADAVAADLKAAGPRALVVAGARQPEAVHLLAARINSVLGSQAVTWQQAPAGMISLSDLAKRLASGQAHTLLVLGGNPAYNAPADLDFVALLRKATTSIRLGLYEDETSASCQWHVPAAHYLESWGDARSQDGTVSAIQPMIQPLFGGMVAIELLARLSGFEKTAPYEIARVSMGRLSGGFTEAAWRSYLQEGIAATKDAGHAKATPPGSSRPITHTLLNLPAGAVTVCFALDASVFDGRFANNGWLQECPDPITKLTWDNAALLSPATARQLGVDTGDVVKVELDGRAIEAPVFVLPGTADWSITLPLGYGRKAGGSLATDAGFNAYALRTTASMGFGVGAKVTKTGRTYPLATTQEHWAMDLQKHLPQTADQAAKERAIIREGSSQEFARDPEFARKQGEHAPIRLNIYAAPKLDGANQWGMTIDLNACVGCNACVMACQAENNVPIVGKDEVIRGREMHWMRLDRYFGASADGGDVIISVQPMACQQCEAAPCEPVCPVNATVHSPEGLNEMVYNRCIGTRYCSNNCPYKVRRFNFFDWNKGTIRADTAPTRDGNIQPNPMSGFSKPQSFQAPMQETLKMQTNPNVTVRMRGVMEKCTYCVQRIEMAKIDARAKVGQGSANAVVDGQPAVKVPDGVIQTACQQVCPTRAITFGDVSDPQSKVSQIRTSPRSYEVLEHLNVKPRTRYLARIRNLNPKLSME